MIYEISLMAVGFVEIYLFYKIIQCSYSYCKLKKQPKAEFIKKIHRNIIF